MDPLLLYACSVIAPVGYRFLRPSPGPSEKKKETETTTTTTAAKSASASGDWLAAAQKAKAEKTGWTIWNGKVLLGGASRQYKQPITLKSGGAIPFNETSAWCPGSYDHWFNIPLDCPLIRNDIGARVTGKLFSTRMPRGLDLKPEDPWTEHVSEKHKKQGRTERAYFEEKVKDNDVNHVWVLVESEEFKEIASECLLDYYQSLGLTVHHTPIHDFTAPSFEHEAKNIKDINLALMAGENVLVHCMGGTGRTGTVIVGAVKNLGVKNPVKFCRRAKSTYLEIKAQEELIEHICKVVTKEMLEKNPNFTFKVILDHLEDLCKIVSEGSGKVVDASKVLLAEERSVLRQLFDIIDLHGHDGIVSVSEFLKLLQHGIANGLDAHAYRYISETALKTLFQTIDPSIPDVSFNEDSITFEHFLTAMSKEPRTDEKIKA